MALTLVPGTLAQPGRGFTFAGASPGEECAACPFRKLCFGLQPGRRYEVSAVRGVTHPCGLHDGGRVHVVEVAEAPFATTLETRLLRGTAATWAPLPCRRPDCPSYALCHPVANPAGRHEIVHQGAAVPCPAGYQLATVRLRPLAGP